MSLKPTLLQLTGLTAIGAVLAFGSALADRPAVVSSRLGSSIKESMDQRDQKAAEQKRQLDLQQQAIKAAQARLQSQLGGPMQAAPGAPGTGAKGSNLANTEQPDQAIQNLAKIYQAMKPAKAAAVFEKLSIDVQIKIAREMRDRSMGQIMGAMSPEGAARLSAGLAGTGQPSTTLAGPAASPSAAAARPNAPKPSVAGNKNATAKPGNRPAT